MLESPLIQIQSPILAIHHETVMFVPDREGWIGSARSGLFAYDTRYLSTYELSFDGARPRLLAAARKVHNLATLTYGNSETPAVARRVFTILAVRTGSRCCS